MSSSDSDSSDSAQEVPKRSRRAFGTYENSLLLDVIDQYKGVIESKKTDFGTIDRKRVAWDKIAEEFNADENTQKRDKKELKKRWENVKYSTRKEVEDHLFTTNPKINTNYN